MIRAPRLFALAFAFLFLVSTSSFAADSGTLVDREIHSDNLTHNLIGVDPTRKLTIYLPPGYNASAQRYPVIYFLPNPFGGHRVLFDQHHAAEIFDRAIAANQIGKFILVSVDMRTPLGSTWYVNSPVTGNWQDFYIRDVVPYIDANFRTLATRNSRGLLGDYIGGYGALRIGMAYPTIFSVVYAMHPVGTGSGVQMLVSRPNWSTIANAKSLSDLNSDGFTPIFASMFQAHLPNPANAPLYFDAPAHLINGKLVIDSAQMARLRDNLFIESLIPKYADNLKSLRALKIDWPRSDGIWDHVYANQALTSKLNEFGIVHEAEEFNGTWGGDPYWDGSDNRVYNEVLPFFRNHLDF
ncbi:MAG TPA: alpha/beta hydrolase-fold protein [Acidobacteriaceae bacterium]